MSLEVSELSIPRSSHVWKKPWAIFVNHKGDATLRTQRTRNLLRFSPNLNSLTSPFFWAATVLCCASYHVFNVQSSSGWYRQSKFYLLILKYLIKSRHLPAKAHCQLGEHPGVPLWLWKSSCSSSWPHFTVFQLAAADLRGKPQVI